MKKNNLILPLLLLATICVCAQKVDYNNIILPTSAQGVDITEKLVQLAWQNYPENRIVELNRNVASLEVKDARWSWLDNFGVAGNLNEFVLNGTEDKLPGGGFLPKYNIYGRIDIGYFVNLPREVKRKKQDLLISENEVNKQKLALRADVLTRYYRYKTSKELLRIATVATEDSYATYSLIEQRFRNGESSLIEYNAALDSYNSQNAKKVNAQGQYDISKVILEEIIGVNMADVEASF